MSMKITSSNKRGQAFTLTEELGRFTVLLGGPQARIEVEPCDHALPEGLVRVFLPMLPGGSSTASDRRPWPPLEPSAPLWLSTRAL